MPVNNMSGGWRGSEVLDSESAMSSAMAPVMIQGSRWMYQKVNSVSPSSEGGG